MRIITAVSGKGGVGKTTTVANLGAILALRGRRVLLLDCNLQNPDLRLHLGVSWFPVSLQEALLQGLPMEGAAVRAWGVELLPALPKVASGMERLPGRLRALEGYDAVLIDTSPGLGVLNAMLLEASDLALLVSTPDPVADADSERLASEMGTEFLKVVNRAENGHAGEGFPVGLWLGMEGAVRRGVPLAARAPDGPAARTYAALAETLLPAPARPETRGGWRGCRPGGPATSPPSPVSAPNPPSAATPRSAARPPGTTSARRRGAG